MVIPFFKFQGTGNDFVLVDQRDHQYLTKADTKIIEKLCNRRFGVGGDGLILLEYANETIRMVYFNSDGRESSMCGNGGRCFAAFAHHLGIVQHHLEFEAIDGMHDALIAPINETDWQIELKMIDVLSIQALEHQDYSLNTGSPHFVRFTESDIKEADMVTTGKSIRYSANYAQEGINVNLVQPTDTGLCMRTYERGVEDETLSCGTGVTAAALAWHHHFGKQTPGKHHIHVQTLGGELEVRFLFQSGKGYTDIWLCGPAVRVFSGEAEL